MLRRLRDYRRARHEVDAAARAPHLEAVARRALCTSALVMRSLPEFAIAVGDGAERRELETGMMPRLRSWLDVERLRDDLTAEERRLVEMPVGGWSRHQVVDATWHVERLGVLLWSLSRVAELPPFDHKFGRREAYEGARLDTAVEAFVRGSCLRSGEELGHAYARARLWHWRAAQRRRGGPLESIIRVTEAAHRDGLAANLIEGDLSAYGRAYAQLDHDEAGEVASIARERLSALRWLTGRGPTLSRPGP